MREFLERLEEDIRNMGDGETIPYYVGEKDIDSYLEERLTNEFPDKEFRIDSINAFGSPGYDTKIVAIAFTEDDALDLYMIQVENC